MDARLVVVVVVVVVVEMNLFASVLGASPAAMLLVSLWVGVSSGQQSVTTTQTSSPPIQVSLQASWQVPPLVLEVL